MYLCAGCIVRLDLFILVFFVLFCSVTGSDSSLIKGLLFLFTQIDIKAGCRSTAVQNSWLKYPELRETDTIFGVYPPSFEPSKK